MTPSQTVGPFFHFLTRNADLGCIARADAKGERIRLHLRLLDGDGLPVPDGMLEIWQADASGKYEHPEDSQEQMPDPMFCGFGRMATDQSGSCMFETVHPGPVPDRHGGVQAPHLNISVFARGLLNRLCTRIYFEGDSALQADPVLALVPEDRRHTLLALRDTNRPGGWNFTIHLQGGDETIFFDI